MLSGEIALKITIINIIVIYKKILIYIIIGFHDSIYGASAIRIVIVIFFIIIHS